MNERRMKRPYLANGSETSVASITLFATCIK